MATNNDKIQFRGETEKEASKVVDDIRPDGINVSELARQGFQEKLRETLSEEEKIELHRRYKQGDISDDVAEILIGDPLAAIEREQASFEDAMELDTSDVFQQ